MNFPLETRALCRQIRSQRPREDETASRLPQVLLRGPGTVQRAGARGPRAVLLLSVSRQENWPPVPPSLGRFPQRWSWLSHQ